MIVLDTNLLDTAKFPGGSLLSMLSSLASHKGRKLAIPEMVRIEHVAHHRHAVEVAMKEARAALRTLSEAFGGDLGKPLLGLNTDDAAAGRRAALGYFTILPTPAGAAEEALIREANRRPPAEREWRDGNGDKIKARGARDAVIWLTLLETAKNTEGPVWFVTQDKDFAENGDWHPSLRAEAAEVLGEERAANLQLVQGGIPALLARLAEPAGLRITELDALLRDQAVSDTVRNTITGPMMFFDLAQRVLPHSHGGFSSSAATDLVFAQRADRPEAFKVAGQVWVTGQIQWTGRKHYTQIQGGAMITEVTAAAPEFVLQPWNASVEFTFSTTVLLKLDDDPRAIREVHVLAVTPFLIERPPHVNVFASDAATGSDDLWLGGTRFEEPNLDEEDES